MELVGGQAEHLKRPPGVMAERRAVRLPRCPRSIRLLQAAQSGINSPDLPPRDKLNLHFEHELNRRLWKLLKRQKRELWRVETESGLFRAHSFSMSDTKSPGGGEEVTETAGFISEETEG